MTIAKRLYLLIALAVASAAILSGMSFYPDRAGLSRGELCQLQHRSEHQNHF